MTGINILTPIVYNQFSPYGNYGQQQAAIFAAQGTAAYMTPMTLASLNGLTTPVVPSTPSLFLCIFLIISTLIHSSFSPKTTLQFFL